MLSIMLSPAVPASYRPDHYEGYASAMQVNTENPPLTLQHPCDACVHVKGKGRE